MAFEATRGTATMDRDRRAEQLHAIARGYVTEGLGKKNFDAIPYHEHVELRAPLCPGGVAVPLMGREALRTVWWAPIPALVRAVRVIDTFVNGDLTASAVEFHLTIADPPCELRIVDRFTVNADGEIVSQENYFDPRDLTDPHSRDA
jgi:hypothetical protein